MREILFRGKRVSGNKEWIFGNANYYPNLNRWFIRLHPVMNVLQTLEDEVAANTVGQYTGLDDKNGRKIFEGDILRLSYGENCIVRWDEENGRFLGFIIGKDNCIAYVGREPKSEIIGNIYDNPELLKEKENENT